MNKYQFNHEHLFSYRCFVDGKHFYGTVLAPSLMLVIAHFIIFIPIFKNVKQADDLLPNTFENRREKISGRAKATFIVNLLMTSLWIIALIHAYLQLQSVSYTLLTLPTIYSV